jgi:hypothetical protein
MKCRTPWKARFQKPKYIGRVMLQPYAIFLLPKHHLRNMFKFWTLFYELDIMNSAQIYWAADPNCYLIDSKVVWPRLMRNTTLACCMQSIECMQRTTARTFWLLLILLSGALSAWTQSKATLSVTAVVQTSATWVQGTDGSWTLIVANAPDSLSTFSFQSGIQRQSVGQVAIKNDAQPRSSQAGSAVDSATHNRSSK